jgi:hypothetical protein
MITTVLLFGMGVAVVVFSPWIGGRISRYNYGDDVRARRLVIAITVIAGVVLLVFGIRRLVR